MDVKVLDEDGKNRTVIMGSYGIGVGRNVAAVVEANCDDKGISWPVNVAPYEVVVTVLNPKDVEPLEAGERVYEKLQELGIDVILDDRDERPGVKFKDAELVGIRTASPSARRGSRTATSSTSGGATARGVTSRSSRPRRRSPSSCSKSDVRRAAPLVCPASRSTSSTATSTSSARTS